MNPSNEPSSCQAVRRGARGERGHRRVSERRDKPACSGNERVLQERSSEPPDLESCGGGREAVVEA